MFAFFFFILTVGMIVLDVWLFKLYIRDINSLPFSSTAIFFITMALVLFTFLGFLGLWLGSDSFSFSAWESPALWINVIALHILIPSLVVLGPKVVAVYNKLKHDSDLRCNAAKQKATETNELIVTENKINHKIVLPLYIATTTFIYLSVCFLINICCNIYPHEIGEIIKKGIFIYILLILGYFYYISSINKTVVLIIKIKRINSKIQKSIKIISKYTNSTVVNFKGYKKVQKKVNKILSRRNIKDTFQPIFEEDRPVLSVVALFNKIADNKISSAYNRYKELFKTENGLKPLEELSDGENPNTYLTVTRDYMALLQGTISNNKLESISLLRKLHPGTLCKKYFRRMIDVIRSDIYIISELKRDPQVDDLCKKYTVFQRRHTEKKLTKNCIVLFLIFCVLLSVSTYKGYYAEQQKYNLAVNLINENKTDDVYFKLLKSGNFKDISEYKYNLAKQYVTDKNYLRAFALFNDISGYKDSNEQIMKLRGKLKYPSDTAVPESVDLEKSKLWTDIVEISAGGSHTVGLKGDGTVVATGDNDRGQCNVEKWSDIVEVFAEDNHTIGLKSDGTVVVAGWLSDEHKDITGWTNISKISEGWNHIVGLKHDGTVVAVGDNYDGQCNVSGWTGVIEIFAVSDRTVGLKSDGTVVVVGDENYGVEWNVSGWTNITSLYVSGVHIVGLKNDGTVVAAGDNKFGQCNIGNWTDIVEISGSEYHTVGLKRDGTVIAVGGNYDGRCDVSGWTNIASIHADGSPTIGIKHDGTAIGTMTENNGYDITGWSDIVAVSLGYKCIVGIKSDGTAVAVGDNEEGQCNVSAWDNIAAVYVGDDHALALRSDGTVVTTGDNDYGQFCVGAWANITEISVGGYHTVGLRSDGTVVATGYNTSKQCDVSRWSDMVSVSAGSHHTVALKSNGKVFATGSNSKGQCDVSKWNNIISIHAGWEHTVGLKSDGTVVAAGENGDGKCNVSAWTDIMAISVGGHHTVGLKSDGTVVAAGSNNDGRCNVSGWTDVVAIDVIGAHTVGLKSDGTIVVTGTPEDTSQFKSPGI